MTAPIANLKKSGARMTKYETDQPVAVTIELSHAMVHIVAEDRGETNVTVNPADPSRDQDVEAMEKTAVDLTNGTLSIKQPKSGGLAASVIGWKRRGAVEVVVEVPERSSLTADTGLADFRCDGLLGDVEVKTGAGSVRVDRSGAVRVKSGAGSVGIEEASGDVEAVTAGDITVGNVVGDAAIKNLNGKTWIRRVRGSTKVRSANGSVIVGDAGGDVSVKTANGDIRLGQISRGIVTVETAAGGLELGVKEGTAAWVDASTKFGKVVNTLSPSEHPQESAETVQIRARTAFGDVLITRGNTMKEPMSHE